MVTRHWNTLKYIVSIYIIHRISVMQGEKIFWNETEFVNTASLKSYL